MCRVLYLVTWPVAICPWRMRKGKWNIEAFLSALVHAAERMGPPIWGRLDKGHPEFEWVDRFSIDLIPSSLTAGCGSIGSGKAA